MIGVRGRGEEGGERVSWSEGARRGIVLVIRLGGAWR